MIEFFADTGARASMVGSLRVGDVELDTERPHFEPNAEASGLKDAPQHNYPLIGCVGPLRSYLRYSHPQPENDDAALFHRFVGTDTTVDDLADAETAMSSQHMQWRLRKADDKAGIDKPTNPTTSDTALSPGCTAKGSRNSRSSIVSAGRSTPRCGRATSTSTARR